MKSLVGTLAIVAMAQGCCRPPCAASGPSGFAPLFNGRDLTGWQGLVADPVTRASMSAAALADAQAAADARMHAHWFVLVGDEGVPMLFFDGGGENLCTTAHYGDFEILLQWRIETGGDSGIYLRGAPQVQIWDHPSGSGGLYNNERHPSGPRVAADRPAGEWNEFLIRMVGERVTVVLNGNVVVDEVVLENYWQRDRAIFERGPIELQAHGCRLWFRDLRVRELE